MTTVLEEYNRLFSSQGLGRSLVKLIEDANCEALCVSSDTVRLDQKKLELIFEGKLIPRQSAFAAIMQFPRVSSRRNSSEYAVLWELFDRVVQTDGYQGRRNHTDTNFDSSKPAGLGSLDIDPDAPVFQRGGSEAKIQLGLRISEQARNIGLSDTKVSRFVNRPEYFIARMKNTGSVELSPIVLVRIAKVLGVNPSELLDGNH